MNYDKAPYYTSRHTTVTAPQKKGTVLGISIARNTIEIYRQGVYDNGVAYTTAASYPATGKNIQRLLNIGCIFKAINYRFTR